MITRRVKTRQRLRKACLDGGDDEVLEALSRAESDATAQDNVAATSPRRPPASPPTSAGGRPAADSSPHGTFHT